ncbi:Gfo/Idh/MocA family protein [Leifsonia poae]|uniref:Gfo/Idh/MocA family protein n=1 Tax=Leifsonia poae TaxID=110933 RepID=UPI003D695677
MMPYGVAIIGAGPGAGALHIPTLGELDDLFTVTHVTDSGSGKAAALAARLGAASSVDIATALTDPSVDVVALISPPDQHARQILAAVDAGVRGIFCEKPLATDHAAVDAVVDACRKARIPLLVGTNHLHDAAWGRATHHLTAGAGTVQSVALTLALPPNYRYHEVVSDAGPFPSPDRGRPDLTDPRIAAAVLRQLLTGLAVHDMPAVRDLAPQLERVLYARLAPPIGYSVGFVASGVVVQLMLTMLPDGYDALWRLTITTDGDRVDVDFPPAFVHAGSATVTVRDQRGRITEYRHDDQDGYVAEWQAFARMVDGSDPVEYDDIRADAHYAIALADAASDLVRTGGDA